MENIKKRIMKIKPTSVNFILLALLLITNLTVMVVSSQKMGDLKRDNDVLMLELRDLHTDTKALLDTSNKIYADAQDLISQNAFLSFKDEMFSKLDELQLVDAGDGMVPLGPYKPPIIQYVQVPTAAATSAPATTQAPTSTSTPEQTTVPEPTSTPVAATPAPKQVAAKNNKIIVTIKAPKVEDMYAYEFKMNFNSDQIVFAGGLKSNISDITMIFSKPFDGYQLVGATMIGKSTAGFNGSSANICEMAFEVQNDVNISDLNLSLSEVAVVDSAGKYVEGVTGWTFETKMAD